MNQLPALIGVFSYLSLLAVGGGMAVFPELKILTVDVHGWLTFPQLIHLYSVGQLSPGPNMMMVTAIGERVAGPLGALAVVCAFFLPSALIAFGTGRLWVRLEGWPWRDALQRGLAPVSIGLVVAGTITVARGAVTGWKAAIIAGLVFGVFLRSRINPALLILTGAVAGLAAFTSP